MKHKRGDTFSEIAYFPNENSPTSEFVGWVPTCQLRTLQGALIADIVTDWVDPATALFVSLQFSDTQAWPIGRAIFDIQFKRTSDEFIISSTTKVLNIVEDVTRP